MHIISFNTSAVLTDSGNEANKKTFIFLLCLISLISAQMTISNIPENLILRYHLVISFILNSNK